MILLIDNYDSFTFNLYQLLRMCDEKQEVCVIRHDEKKCEELLAMQPSHIVLSPGPKTPNESGVCLELIGKVAGKIPLLGVCLGHQAIAVAFGGNFKQAKQIMHGKTSQIYHDGQGIFLDLPNPFEATRYHSLAVGESTFPESLQITARTQDGEIMGLQHRELPIYGVQFHPESILTVEGKGLLQNFLKT